MLLASQRKSNGRRAPGAFTLAELLVVVAVTVVLASLLLPALSGAKEKSRRAVCQENVHELLMAVSQFAGDHSDNLPSSADNYGYYHSVRLSDETYTNFVTEYLNGVSATLYCPNVDFDGITNHDESGYIIGYNYLAVSMVTTEKGPDYWVGTTKLTAPGPTPIFADANYWSTQPIGSTGYSMQMAPHTPMGASMKTMSTTTRSVAAPPTSQSLGATGGNVGQADMSVTWKPMKKMGVWAASDRSDAHGDW